MSLNGIMGIGLLSVGVEDERQPATRGEHDAQQPVGMVKPDNLSAVQEDYVTLNSGVGHVPPARAAGVDALGHVEPDGRGGLFQAIA